jgi:hypothetical protein
LDARCVWVSLVVLSSGDRSGMQQYTDGEVDAEILRVFDRKGTSAVTALVLVSNGQCAYGGTGVQFVCSIGYQFGRNQS